MTVTALIRKWRVLREYFRLIGHHVDQGFSLTAYHRDLYRAEAEKRVP